MSTFTADQNKEYWNEYAKKIKDSTFGASDGNHLVEIENQFIFSELQSRKSNSLLDIGCGNGQRTIQFSKYVDVKTLGIDYSEEMIKEAKLYLSTQDAVQRQKLDFRHADVNNFEEKSFDVITSCRCFINQTSHNTQLELFKKLHEKLNPGGSLIMAEISLEGMNSLNAIRSKYGLTPMKPRWHNLHINEKLILHKLDNLYTIKKIRRAGTFYYISRVIHPAIVHPEEPKQNAVINDIALRSEIILQQEFGGNTNSLEKFGAHLLVHLVKK